MTADSFSAAMSWLDDAYRTYDSDFGALIVVAIGFSTMFLISWGIFVSIEKLLIQKPLPWSGLIVSLLIAATFWATPSPIIGELVAILAGRRNIHNYGTFLLNIAYSLLLSVWVPFLFNPFGILGLVFLLLYLARPNFPRSILIAGILLTVAACCEMQLFYNHNPDLTRS